MNLNGGLTSFGQSHNLGREYEQEKKGSRAEAPSQEQEAGREEKSSEARKIKGNEFSFGRGAGNNARARSAG
jgi:hypothetical protein